jgi:hypothetical protein
MRCMAPPQQDVGLIQHHRGQTLIRFIQRGGVDVEVAML